MTAGVDTVQAAPIDWLQRFNKLKAIELLEDKQAIGQLMQEILDLIESVQCPRALQQMLAFLENELPKLEAQAERFSKLKKYRA